MKTIVPEAWKDASDVVINIGLNHFISTSMLLSVKQVLDDSHIRFMLAFGTCLGAVRSGRFIEFDTDIDIALHVQDRDAVLDAINALKFRDRGMLVMRDHGWLTSLEFERQYLDLYFFSPQEGRYWSGHYSLTRVEMEHPDTIQFLGLEFLTPNNPEAYLQQRYGDDWRIPIPGKHATT